MSTATDAGTLLAVEKLTSGYGANLVLHGVSIEVPASSVVALVGANGAGKSTLLRTISGLLPAANGKVMLNGENVTKLAASERVKRGMSCIPEGRAVFKSLSVKDNLTLQAPKGESERAVELASSIFPILGRRLTQLAGTLSGGEQQMLAICRAYISRPQLVLVDEPSLGLAPIVVDEIFEFLGTIRSRGASLLLVDQFVNRALGMADYAYVLRRGSIVNEGLAAELRDSDIVSEYLGTAELG